MISSEQTIFNLTIFRPISCYTGSLTAEIKGDVSLDESLKTCAMYEDVCFGKVILTVSNDTQNSVGYVQVYCHALCPFCVCMSKTGQTQTDTKFTF